MPRRLHTILSALSLLLFLAFATLYIRSYFIRDIVAFARTTGHSHIAQSILGRLHIMTHYTGQPASDHFSHSADHLVKNAIWNGGMSSYPLQPRWRLGCIYQTYTRTHMGLLGQYQPYTGQQLFTSSHRLVVIPYYYPTALFALLPLISLFRLLRHRHRIRPGLCQNCAYDLRASKSRCPECGTPIPQENNN